MYKKVYLEITNTCNMSCSFCHGTKRAPKRLTLEELELVTDKLVGVTKYLYLHVMGEPLTHPHLTEMISSATAKGFNCAITTNGVLLPKLSEKLLSSGIYKVSISLHSFEEGGDAFFEKYINDCADFAKAASDKGILTVFRLWNKGHDGGRNERVLALLKDRLDGEWKWSERGARIKDKLHLEYGERFVWPDINAPDMGDEVFCYGLKDQFAILSDGTLVPCCLDSDGAIALGNAFSENISDILTSERAVAMRQGFMKRQATEELCKRCGYARKFAKNA